MSVAPLGNKSRLLYYFKLWAETKSPEWHWDLQRERWQPNCRNKCWYFLQTTDMLQLQFAILCLDNTLLMIIGWLIGRFRHLVRVLEKDCVLALNACFWECKHSLRCLEFLLQSSSFVGCQQLEIVAVALKIFSGDTLANFETQSSTAATSLVASSPSRDSTCIASIFWSENQVINM